MSVPERLVSEEILCKPAGRAGWEDVLAQVSALHADLLTVNPEDVGARYRKIYDVVRSGSEGILEDIASSPNPEDSKSYWRALLTSVMAEMQMVEQLAQVRSAVAQDALLCFQRADLPEGSLFSA